MNFGGRKPRESILLFSSLGMLPLGFAVPRDKGQCVFSLSLLPLISLPESTSCPSPGFTSPCPLGLPVCPSAPDRSVSVRSVFSSSPHCFSQLPEEQTHSFTMKKSVFLIPHLKGQLLRFRVFIFEARY